MNTLAELSRDQLDALLDALDLALNPEKAFRQRWVVGADHLVNEDALLDHEASLEAPEEEWQPSMEDLAVLYDMRKGPLPDEFEPSWEDENIRGWTARYQRGSRFA